MTKLTSSSPWLPHELRQVNHCPACGAPSVANKIAGRLDSLAIKECQRCALLYVDPVPNDDALQRCYGPTYYSEQGGAGASSLVGYAAGVNYHKSRQAELAAGGPLGFEAIKSSIDLNGKSVLEIGCADGALLASLKSLGPARLVGIDINDAALNLGRTRYGLDLRHVTIEKGRIRRK